MKIKITLIEEMLGSQPSNKEIHAEFVGSKSCDAEKLADEQAALPSEELIEKGMTVFYRHDDKPAMMDYQLKGFFKEACSAMVRLPDSKSKELKAWRKIVNQLVFVSPRTIPLQDYGTIGNCQRPLRGQTSQGERISLANSETVPAGTWFECEITMLDPRHEKYVEEWLNYGKFKGLGQWNNSGKGRFEWKRC